jgi:hypothetical protein
MVFIAVGAVLGPAALDVLDVSVTNHAILTVTELPVHRPGIALSSALRPGDQRPPSSHTSGEANRRSGVRRSNLERGPDVG